MTGSRIRSLRLEDIPVVVGMLHESFDSHLRPFMTYTQRGIGEFLSVPLHYPGLPSDRIRLVMERQGNIVGFADYRVMDPQTGHLSYICVKASARGTGVATALISEFVHEHPGVEMLSLDVFRHNLPARALYAKLGFEASSTSGWVTRSLPAPTGTVSIQSVEASVAAYRRHGFCELDVHFKRQSVNIGLIGPHVLRCFSVESFENDALLSGVRHVFKMAEHAMVVMPEAQLVQLASPHTLETLTDRMYLKIDAPRKL